MDSINPKSPDVNPFSTRAENPPMKSIPRFFADLSNVWAIFT